jgi:hypothetical protein
VEVVWVFLPLLGAFVVHAPVLRFRLLPSLARPIDGGRTLRGRRIFGDNKTWRGALVMPAGVLAATCGLAHVPAYWSKLPMELQRSGPVVFGLLLGFGAIFGELPNSFAKRQLDIDPGRQLRSPRGIAFVILDQGDFVLGAWLFLAPIWLMPIGEAAAAFVVVLAVHLVVNVIGYAIGARKSWL